MTQTSITQKDIADIKRLAGISLELDQKQNDIAFANKVTDELYHHQPFILSMLMGYKMDLLPAELTAVINLYILIWEFFKIEPQVLAIPITQQHYEKVEMGAVRWLQKLEAIRSDEEKEMIVTKDLNKSSSKALTGIIFKEFKEGLVLEKMDVEKKGILLIGFRSVIQCFENISSGLSK
ncbi:MAG: hypothetical protein ABI675_21990 [Chitinophagaceae bacterium]